MPISTSRSISAPAPGGSAPQSRYLISDAVLTAIERNAQRTYMQVCCLFSFTGGVVFGVVIGFFSKH